jgi:hypothetical protein
MASPLLVAIVINLQEQIAKKVMITSPCRKEQKVKP